MANNVSFFAPFFSLKLTEQVLFFLAFIGMVSAFFSWFHIDGSDVMGRGIEYSAFSGVASILGRFFFLFTSVHFLLFLFSFFIREGKGIFKKYAYIHCILSFQAFFSALCAYFVYLNYSYEIAEGSPGFGLYLALLSQMLAMLYAFYYLLDQRNREER